MIDDPNFPGLFDKPSRPVLGMNDVMPFGKHSGEKLRDIDPDYLKWVHENVDRVELGEDALEYALEPDDDFPF